MRVLTSLAQITNHGSCSTFFYHFFVCSLLIHPFLSSPHPFSATSPVPCLLSFLSFFSLSLTTTIKDRLSQQELDAAKEYDQILQEYMDDVGVDLCKGMQPPKSVRIAVKVKEDFGKSTHSFIHLNFSIFQNLPIFLPSSPCIQKSFPHYLGELVTDSGVMNLQRNTTLFMRRDEVEPLIRQGVLEHMQASVQ